MAPKKPILINNEFGEMSRTEFRKRTKQEKLELMRAWFAHRYEDPVHHMSYISAEGGYQYRTGGPYDAREELSDTFYDLVPEKWIDDLVVELEEDGTTEWAGTIDDDDYFEGQNDPVELGSEAERDLRSHVVQRLGNVTRAIADRPQSHGMMGHNQPPDLISEEEERELETLDASITEITNELGSAVPDPAVVAKQFHQAIALRDRLGVAALRKLDIFTDEFAKALGKELGKSLGKLVFWGPLVIALVSAISWLESWLQAIGHL